RRRGTIVSFDLNSRPSLWKANGGPEAAAAVKRQLVGEVDVLFGNEEDLSAALGYGDFGAIDVDAYAVLHGRVLEDYPNLQIVATSLRVAHTATTNDWSGVCSTRDGFFV